MKSEIAEKYSYNLDLFLDDIRHQHTFDSTTPTVVPLALLCVIEARTTEDAVRNAVSLGGDSDTLASIAGAVAEAFFGIPDALKQEVLKRLPESFLNVMAHFREYQAAHQ